MRDVPAKLTRAMRTSSSVLRMDKTKDAMPNKIIAYLVHAEKLPIPHL